MKPFRAIVFSADLQKGASPLDLAAAIAELRDGHLFDTKRICTELGITEQTVRDIALLEQAPKQLHDLVRSGAVAGTLAISEIRAHGGEKALERIVAGLSKAKEAGKSKVTKKHLASKQASCAPKLEATAKIGNGQAKQLLQALQSVLHDPMFGQLSPGTIHGVHAALSGLEDLLDPLARPTPHPIHVPNEHGVFDKCEAIAAPRSKTKGESAAKIHIAQAERGKWIYGFTLRLGTTGMHTPPSMKSFVAVLPTRGQAIRAAVSDITRALNSSADMSQAKGADIVRKWLDKLYAAPDPDWTTELAARRAIEKEAS